MKFVAVARQQRVREVFGTRELEKAMSNTLATLRDNVSDESEFLKQLRRYERDRRILVECMDATCGGIMPFDEAMGVTVGDVENWKVLIFAAGLPRFQLDRWGHVRPIVGLINVILDVTDRSKLYTDDVTKHPITVADDAAVAAWWTTTNVWLDGRRPVDLLLAEDDVEPTETTPNGSKLIGATSALDLLHADELQLTPNHELLLKAAMVVVTG